ncbi:MAG: DUF5107 domain-containing protein [Saprospiraceae bacterium]|nr:DUF5107 domain-containing protein [Saprospiraceae bacterium]
MNVHTHTPKFCLGLVTLWFALFTTQAALTAQPAAATIVEAKTSLLTYPFSDPDPLPILVHNPKIYPYHRFDGYSLEGQDQEWTTVTLSNDYVEVYVLPEVGGKVWGAIEKESGEEFIYRNEVMKFRNIAMRGPWTSGGIEFNFGLIGHHPGTATPVDYILQEEADGSVSCTVGNIDLPSRTQWRVKIRLPKDKAYFETQATWYNPTPLQQAYYNWMTAAAAARQDLEFFTPGNQYLEHGGRARSWPYDEEERFLPAYQENDFGPSKSYHVVGKDHDFFGGYFHDQNFGFGHWAEYEEMPGQKLWLWALSRSGGIWEDLLTDTDGQYIEFQAGRLFVQYSPGADQNPVTQANFPPHTTDQWTEKWFPVKEIGGLSDVSDKAILHAQDTKEGTVIGINALSEVNGRLELTAKSGKTFEASVQLKPMGVFQKTFPLPLKEVESVKVKAMDLELSLAAEAGLLKRPFYSPVQSNAPAASAEKHFRSGMEAMKYRAFEEAVQQFEACLKLEPQHLEALTQMAELYYRNGQYQQAITYAHQALQWDTYHPGANFVAGLIYQAQGDLLNARESLGWAARSMSHRSAAYAEMAGVYLQEEDWQKAQHYAQKSLDFNRYNLSAWESMAIAARQQKNSKLVEDALAAILEVDPLNHFAFFEQYLLQKSEKNKAAFLARHRSELPEQTFLELALSYYRKGQISTAKEVLQLAPQKPLVQLWMAYLGKDVAALAPISATAPTFTFPYRRESLEALEWAIQQSEHWTFKYYLALNYWGKNRRTEALGLMDACGQQPSFAPFYLSRAHLSTLVKGENAQVDMHRAQAVGSKDWRVQRSFARYLIETDQSEEAIRYLKGAWMQHSDNYAIGMDLVRQLVYTQQYQAALAILDKLEVLPFEGASEGRLLHQQANTGAAIEWMESGQWKSAVKHLEQAKQWPERLGVGKPYDPDERLSDFLLAQCYAKLGDNQKSTTFYGKVWQYTEDKGDHISPYHVLGLLSHQILGREKKESPLTAHLQEPKYQQNPDVQWIQAMFAGDEAALKLLELRYPDRWQSIQLQLLEQAVDMVKK